jgi:hypothetical protein
MTKQTASSPRKKTSEQINSLTDWIAPAAKIERGRKKLVGKFEADALDLNTLPAHDALALAKALVCFVQEQCWQWDDEGAVHRICLRIALTLQKKHDYRDQQLKADTMLELARLMTYIRLFDEACCLAAEGFVALPQQPNEDELIAWARDLINMGEIGRALDICERLFTMTGQVPLWEFEIDVAKIAGQAYGADAALIWARREKASKPG